MTHNLAQFNEKESTALCTVTETHQTKKLKEGWAGHTLCYFSEWERQLLQKHLVRNTSEKWYSRFEKVFLLPLKKGGGNIINERKKSNVLERRVHTPPADCSQDCSPDFAKKCVRRAFRFVFWNKALLAPIGLAQSPALGPGSMVPLLTLRSANIKQHMDISVTRTRIRLDTAWLR